MTASRAGALLPASRPRPAGWRSAWDALSIYLPVLIMGALALGSYWMLRSAPLLPAPTPEQAPVHEADYFMRDFSSRTFFPDGRLKSELFGSYAQHFPDNDSIEVENARIRSFNESGQLTTANAQRLKTDGKQSHYLLEGEVVVVRESATSASGRVQPALSFRGEQLRVLDNSKKVESDRPVVMTRNQDRVTADTLRYDDASKVAVLRGRVRAVLAPAAK